MLPRQREAHLLQTHLPLEAGATGTRSHREIRISEVLLVRSKPGAQYLRRDFMRPLRHSHAQHLLAIFLHGFAVMRLSQMLGQVRMPIRATSINRRATRRYRAGTAASRGQRE